MSRITSEELPTFVTVEEAASILRIGRTVAYQLARRWEETNGGEGLPVLRFGRLLRVPRAALEALHGGPLSAKPARTVVEVVTHTQTEPTPAHNAITVPPTVPPPAARIRRRRAKHSTDPGSHPTLPFTG